MAVNDNCARVILIHLLGNRWYKTRNTVSNL